MKLEDLVPPLELCKLIPKGEFEDSAFQWQEATIKGNVSVDIIQHYPLEWGHPEWAKLYPAPTLEEIIKKLPIGTACGKGHHGEIWLGYSYNRKYACQEQEGATAALKLWLKLKGIEYENV